MIVSRTMLFLPNLQTDNKIDKYGHNADDDWYITGQLRG